MSGIVAVLISVEEHARIPALEEMLVWLYMRWLNDGGDLNHPEFGINSDVHAMLSRIEDKLLKARPDKKDLWDFYDELAARYGPEGGDDA